MGPHPMFLLALLPHLALWDPGPRASLSVDTDLQFNSGLGPRTTVSELTAWDDKVPPRRCVVMGNGTTDRNSTWEMLGLDVEMDLRGSVPWRVVLHRRMTGPGLKGKR